MESITRQRERAEEYYVALMALHYKSKKPEDEAAARAAGVRFQELQYQEALEYRQAAEERNRRTTQVTAPVAAQVAAPAPVPVPASTSAPTQTARTVDQAAADKAAVDQANYNFNIGAIVIFILIILLIGMFFMFLQNKKPDSPYMQPMQPMQ